MPLTRLKVTGIRLEEGTGHEHISHIFGPDFGSMTVAEAVERIDAMSNVFYIGPTNLGRPIAVSVFRPPASSGAAQPYLKARSNGAFLNNLLTLPRK